MTNYRCPAPVVRRAVRLIETNTERFRKEVRAGPSATGLLVLAPDAGGGEAALRRFLGGALADGATRAVLARTNRELMLPLAIALDMGLPVRATVRLLLEEPVVDVLLDNLRMGTPAGAPLLLRLGMVRDRAVAGPAPLTGVTAAHAEAPSVSQPGAAAPDPDVADQRDVANALLGWAGLTPGATADEFVNRLAAARRRLAELRRDDARLILATAHGTKGLEFDEVAVIGMDDGRFPSERTLAEASDPARVLEEERRLAYVAWTRARRVLTLVFDPLRPSPFLLEAFSREELDLPEGAGIGGEPVGGRHRQNDRIGDRPRAAMPVAGVDAVVATADGRSR